MKMPRTTDAILRDIETLTLTPGYMHVIAEIASRDLFFNGKEAATVNWRDRVSYQELSLLIGLAIKKTPISYPELLENDLEKKITQTRKLLEELHWSYNDQYMKLMGSVMGKFEDVHKLSDEEKDYRFKKIFGSSFSMIEAVFYSDSGSYDFQYLEMAPKLYQFDSKWLNDKGLDFQKAKIFYQAIKFYSEGMHDLYTHPELVKDKPMRAIDQFTFSKLAIMETAIKLHPETKISDDDFMKFLALFSAKPEEQFDDLKAPGDLNIVNIKPILVIAEGAYFVPVEFNLAEALYESPAFWMRQDKKYIDTAAKNRGSANEQITFDYFKQIFGDFAFKSLKIIKGKNTLTDIDVMGVIGSTAVIVQNKGKKMTLGARQGVEEQLKEDFRLAIQSAYDQGDISRDVILGTDNYKLIDENGKEIVLPTGIEEVYVMCVTADVYPAILHQVEVYLEKPKDKPWPIPLSLFDLDMLALYLPDPYDFVFYIKQRIELTEIARATGEMALLGFHLKHGLFKPRDADRFLIDQDYAQLVDADYMHRKGRLKSPGKKHALLNSWRNKQYEQLLRELRTNIRDPKLTDIIFYLKTIPPNVIDGFLEMVSRTRQKAAKDGLPHNMSMPITDEDEPWGGVSYVLGHSLREIKEKLSYIVGVNKYKHKARRWLGIGALVSGNDLTNAVLFGWDDWEQSDEMDRLVIEHDAKSKGYEVNLKVVKNQSKRGKTTQKIDNKQKKKKARKARRNARRRNT